MPAPTKEQREYLLAHFGRPGTMKELAAESNVPLTALYQRWFRGDRGPALTRPYRSRRWSVKPSGETACE